jgi:hypothetical protein
MKLIDLTLPLGIATPPWPTYEPLQVKYFKRLAPNGAKVFLTTHFEADRPWTDRGPGYARSDDPIPGG